MVHGRDHGTPLLHIGYTYTMCHVTHSRYNGGTRRCRRGCSRFRSIANFGRVRSVASEDNERRRNEEREEGSIHGVVSDMRGATVVVADAVLVLSDAPAHSGTRGPAISMMRRAARDSA